MAFFQFHANIKLYVFHLNYNHKNFSDPQLSLCWISNGFK